MSVRRWDPYGIERLTGEHAVQSNDRKSGLARPLREVAFDLRVARLGIRPGEYERNGTHTTGLGEPADVLETPLQNFGDERLDSTSKLQVGHLPRHARFAQFFLDLQVRYRSSAPHSSDEDVEPSSEIELLQPHHERVWREVESFLLRDNSVLQD